MSDLSFCSFAFLYILAVRASVMGTGAFKWKPKRKVLLMKKLLVVFLACAGGGMPLAGCGPDNPNVNDTVIEGIVAVGPDGLPSVRYVEVPRADYELAVQAKTLLSAGRLNTSESAQYLAAAGFQSDLDTTCNPNSMWLHEGLNQGGPILCFAENATPGATSIAAYFFSDGNRGTLTRSIWAGNHPGMFHNPGGGGGPAFSTFQRIDSISLGSFPFLDQW